MRKPYQIIFPILLVCFVPAVARAQSFRVQCPTSTVTHPASNPNSPTGDNNSEPPYTVPTTQSLGTNGFLVPTANVNGAIKCQQVGGGDGYSTMANGTQTYMFSFGPLSGLADIAAGQPRTEVPRGFNTQYMGIIKPGDPRHDGWGARHNHNLPERYAYFYLQRRRGIGSRPRCDSQRNLHRPLL